MKPQAVADFLVDRSDQSDFHRRLDQVRAFLTLEVIDMLKERVDDEKWRDPRRALQIAQVAQAAASCLVDPQAKAVALWARGTALYYLSRYQEALDCFRRAEAIYRQQQAWLAVVRLQIGQIAMLTEIGNYHTILELEQQARSTCQKLGREAPRCLAGLEMNVGAAYEQMGDLRAALEAYQRGRAHFATLGEDTQVARIDINRAVVLEQLDRFADAEQLLLGARAALAEAGHHLEVARADLNLGVLAYRRGLYQTALQRLELAHSGFAAVSNPSEIATVDLYRSFVYRDLNLLEDLILLAARAEQRFRQNGARWQQTLAIINQGIGYWRLGAHDKAEEHLFQARDLLDQQGAHNRLLMLDLERATLALEAGRVEAAWGLANQVQAQATSLDWPLLHARVHLLLARCGLAAMPTDLSQVRRQAEAALAIAEDHALHEPAIEAHHLLGQIFEASGDAVGAWCQYQTAVQAIERLRSGLLLDEFQMGFMDDKLPVYQAIVRLSQQIGTPAQVLAALNLAQTAPLLRLSPRVQPGTAADRELLQRLRRLRETWHWHQSKLEGSAGVETDVVDVPTAATEFALRQQLRELEAQIAELSRRWQVRTTSPAGPATASDHPGPGLDGLAAARFLEDLQARLGPNEALLQYFEERDQFHALLVTRSHVRLTHDLVAIGALRRLLRAWRFHLEHVRAEIPGNALTAVARTHLARLYQGLFASLAHELRDHDHLYVVLPPAWHDLPLSGLFDGEQHLVQRFRLTYLSAPEVLLNSTPVQQTARDGHALVVGYSDGERLPHAVAEARQVAAALRNGSDTVLALEEDATLERLRSASRSIQTLHLATHAVFRPDNPVFSWIRLADARLTVAELYEITLPQRPLVVLSACETGRGQPRGGGLLGMGRGFLASGASGLVVSLWPVADLASAHLMADFYGYLTGDRLTPAAALCQSQQQALERQPHPFYWAGFVFIQA